ncbi:MAG: RagB/SusD family nutrient uptake outer membrane protein, partial [Bacteroidales bacterium]|nr:RagB/SusD family nutrient uptake outer membrane protein [Bacteroidales bacterium]
MKKIFLALFAVIVMIASGCSGFLDENPKSAFVGVEAYSNPKLVYINCVASLYVPRTMPNLSEFDQVLYYFDNCASDLVITPGRRNGWVDGGPHQQVFQHDFDQTFSKLADAWNALYTYIALCNRSLDQVKEIIAGGGDEKLLAPYISEITILRDIYYSIALDYWGRIPIVTTGSTSISEVKQLNRSEAYKWLLEDVATNIPNLASAKSQNTGEYYGRMTKAIGYMLLQELAINAPIYNLDNWAQSPYIASIVADNYPDAHGYSAPTAADDSKIFPPELIKTGRYVYDLDGV